MDEKHRWSESYTYGETRTGFGQMLAYTCSPTDVTRIDRIIRKCVRSMDIQSTGRVNVPHGSFGQYTRYDITQHDYAGGGPGEGDGWGCAEVLEVKNPPQGYHGIVINECSSDMGSIFSEWKTVESARKHFEVSWQYHERKSVFPKLDGFIRTVTCGALTPWFYAIGNQQLVGDYAFPEGLQDDPVYRFGKKFIVYDRDGIPSVKTCMGTRFLKYRTEEGWHTKDVAYRLVYWHDGSVWDEHGSQYWWSGKEKLPQPRELLEGEEWITEAVTEFQKLLSGKTTKFELNFTDGIKFIGRVAKVKSKVGCTAGDYSLVVHVEGENKPRRGWVHDFKPTPETPDIVSFVTKKLKNEGLSVKRVQIVESKTLPGGKKWAGVFYNSPIETK